MRINLIFPLILIVFIFSCSQEEQKQTAPPNVLFIAIDDLNNWLGCIGDHPDAKTPNMDRLASQGVLFTNAYCQAPLCGPSRASIMTGLRPSTTGIYGMIDDKDIKQVLPDITLLPEYFKNNGYHTMGIGKLFHQHAPEGVFDESGGRTGGFGPRPDERFVWDGIGTSDPEIYGRTSTDWGAYPEVDSLMIDYQSADWTIERLNRNYDKPFFLAVGFIRPHVPLYAPQKWFDMHPVDGLAMTPYKADDLEDIPEVGLKINDLPMMPSTDWAIESGNWDDIIQAYLACVTFVDAQVGRVLDALEKSEHAGNTIIVLWSDHGYRLGEKGTFAKHALWEEAVNAPLMFSAPDLPTGKVIDQPVEMLSIYPTLLELSGLPVYARNEGISLVELMKSEESEKDYVAVSTFGMNNHAVRTPQYRYIRYEDGTEELYDHSTDPNEWTNISGSANDGIVQKLSSWLPKTNVKWAEPSSYTFQPYFVEQKERVGVK